MEEVPSNYFCLLVLTLRVGEIRIRQNLLNLLPPPDFDAPGSSSECLGGGQHPNDLILGDGPELEGRQGRLAGLGVVILVDQGEDGLDQGIWGDAPLCQG